MPLTRGFRQLVDDAMARIRTITLAEAQAKLADPEVLFVDIREARELEREGMIPGAFSAPRGMLEFWVDPQSPYHKPVFQEGRELVLYCQGAWRSALATAALVDMGWDKVSHIEGGFGAWKQSGAPVAERPRKG